MAGPGARNYIKMMDKEEKLQRVKSLLSYGGHSQRYQSIPEFVSKKVGNVAGAYASDQLYWDPPRYQWIDANLPADVSSAVELGSSLGYFSLRLSHERKIAATGYEPVADYAEVCNLFASLTQMENRTRFVCQSVGIDDIAGLPDADAVISLNVLHHAGNVFDAAAVRDHVGWTRYATEFLQRLNRKFKHMVFQTGNSVAGVAHFPSEVAVPVMAEILKASGWQVRSIGVITDFDTPVYQTYPLAAMGAVPRIRCHRNDISGLVEYRSDGKLLATLKYGTLQRPLFYCSRA